MDLDLNKEQRILKSSARDFLKKESPSSFVREMWEDPKGYSPEMWAKMADLGWIGVMIPERYGGIGGDFVDLAILLECMGEACFPGPFFSTVVLGGLTIMAAGTEEQKKDLLPRLVDGELFLALAVTEPGTWYGAEGVSLKATQDGEDYVLDGTKLFVDSADFADCILCVARTDQGQAPGGLTVFLVDGKTQGITCSPLVTLNHDKQCEVVFDKVRVPAKHILGQPHQAFQVIEEVQTKAAVAKCAQLVGGLQWTLNTTVAYAKDRHQFGRPIGSFQAVQHHCANMVIDVDGARFITYQAAWKIARDLPHGMDAAMAKVWTSNAAKKTALLGHQIHGAISFCEEHDMHLYYRQAKAGEVAFGDADYHLERVALLWVWNHPEVSVALSGMTAM
ncbi:acyl-CoA dehydrogenase family protein, partial [Thermodesulfobacteriota bacterium]